MLKIKDNVDLKELEKFGFKQYYDQPVYECNCKTQGGLPLTVNIITRKFGFNTYQGGVWNKIDVLFDLIQAGLVEKVGDNA